MIRIKSPQDAARRMTAAARNHFPVTITYTREDGSTTIRTIEVYEFTRNKSGDRYVKAMVRTDKPEGELRSFRLDRVVFLTVHRTSYKLTVPEPKSVQRPVRRPAAEILNEMAHGTPERSPLRSRSGALTLAARMLLASDPDSPAAVEADKILDRYASGATS